MSLLLDALKKAAQEKENNKALTEEVGSHKEKSEGYSHEIDEDFLLEEEVVPSVEEKPVAVEELVTEENLNLDLQEEVSLTDESPEISPEVKKDKADQKKQSEVVTEPSMADVVIKEKAAIESRIEQAERDLRGYDHNDARKILEVTQKRYRNNQRIAYYGMYVFATLLFFTGSYLYYTAEVLDNSDKPVFKTKNIIAKQPKTEIEKKIEKQVSIAKAKLVEIDNSDEKDISTVVVKTKEIIKPVKKKQEIVITSQKKSDPLSLMLQKAYEHYQAAEYQKADELYQSVILRDKRQKDALLGRAAIALVNKDYSAARGLYQQLLHFYPKDSIASSALVDLSRQELTIANESQLNILLRDNPKAAHIYFSLGLLYAKQQRINESQQAFFEAYALDKKADYAYNLAVMLDKLGQVKAALSYYRQASLLSDNNASNFNEKLALERIAQLEAGNE